MQRSKPPGGPRKMPVLFHELLTQIRIRKGDIPRPPLAVHQLMVERAIKSPEAELARIMKDVERDPDQVSECLIHILSRRSRFDLIPSNIERRLSSIIVPALEKLLYSENGNARYNSAMGLTRYYVETVQPEKVHQLLKSGELRTLKGTLAGLDICCTLEFDVSQFVDTAIEAIGNEDPNTAESAIRVLSFLADNGNTLAIMFIAAMKRQGSDGKN